MQPEEVEPDRVQKMRSGPIPDDSIAGDDALMARVAGGDARAFENIVNREIDRALAVARRVVGNDAEAEDVAQEALLRLWGQAARWRPGQARIRTWLYRVSVNLSIDRLRQRRGELMAEPPEGSQPADQQQSIEQQELSRSMDGALQALPDRQRIALVLFHYEGASMTEVAEVLETSADAVESLLARGRRSLKKRLAPQWRAMLPDVAE